MFSLDYAQVKQLLDTVRPSLSLQNSNAHPCFDIDIPTAVLIPDEDLQGLEHVYSHRTLKMMGFMTMNKEKLREFNKKPSIQVCDELIEQEMEMFSLRKKQI